MAVVNITIDQNADTTITVADATAAATDKVIMQFYENGNNVLNLATPNLGGSAGDIVIDPGVGYDFEVTDDIAKKLPLADLTYAISKVQTDQPSNVIQNGEVTNTPLTGSEEVATVNWFNGDRKVTTSANLSIKADNDVIYASAPSVDVVELTLPDADTMAGKRFEIKSLNVVSNLAGVDVKKPNGTTLIHLDAGESCQVKAKGSDENDWELFYQ